MPIFFQQSMAEDTRLAVWEITEDEPFFLAKVPLHRSITHPHKRLQHLAGRYLLQHLFPDFPINLIQIADTRKPYLPNEAYHFSLSHCARFAAAIVSRQKRVGVDIEVPSPKVQKIAAKFLHPSEMAWATKAAKEERPDDGLQTLTLLWSCKEAVFKWWSYGNVDFSEMIRLEEFTAGEQGLATARFVQDDRVQPLALQYRLWEKLCLAWVVE